MTDRSPSPDESARRIPFLKSNCLTPHIHGRIHLSTFNSTSWRPDSRGPYLRRRTCKGEAVKFSIGGVIVGLIVCFPITGVGLAQARDLTFEDRVAAQE